MTRLNWEKEKRITRQKQNKVLLYEQRNEKRLERKLQLATVLAEKGWDICPQCKGGKHPAFPICRNCKNKIPIKTLKLKSYCKRCGKPFKKSKLYKYCYLCSMKIQQQYKADQSGSSS